MDITANTPKPVDPQLIREVDVVVTLGRDARVRSDPGTRLEDWDTDEPSERGIVGSNACASSVTTSRLG